MEIATFGAGCFWGVEAVFQKIKGVLKTTVGYMGGNIKNPTYEQVCTDKTGHVEVIQITYDPEQISYDELLDLFWKIHDPTQLNRQGPDIGTQYKSVIFYHDKMQKKISERSINKQQKNYNKKIVTEIKPALNFYPAEEYHQKYFDKHGFSNCKL
jgi:peptide-methionine (S)-S-oxide reductase